MIGPGTNRLIHWEVVSDMKDWEDTVGIFAGIVRELSGDWVTEIKCDRIQHPERMVDKENGSFYNEVVYFGDPKELEDGGRVEALRKLSQVDRYNFDEERVAFYYNKDPECRKQRELQEDKDYIIFFMGENSVPYMLDVEKEDINLNRLVFDLALGV